MHDIVAPVLLRRGVPATFFVATAFLDQSGIAYHNAISLILDRLTQPLPESTNLELDRALPSAFGPHGDPASRLLSIRYHDRSVVNKLAAVVGLDLDRYLDEVRPYLSSDAVRSLIQQGFTIGAHSHDHPPYAELSLEDQIVQTSSSMDLLVRRFGVQTRAFAFPYTGEGVGSQFYEVMFGNRILDVCFGTGGLVKHFHPRSIERVSMEKTSATAAQIVGRQYARAIYYGSRRTRSVAVSG
jgi:peptidoglycan/xylan/chitin deacetylase (PgdA/CDA1 family)